LINHNLILHIRAGKASMVTGSLDLMGHNSGCVTGCSTLTDDPLPFQKIYFRQSVVCFRCKNHFG